MFDDDEVKALRRYLLNGGFLMVDDFWGEDEWDNFYEQINRVFPDREPVELPLEHPIFHCVYDLKKKPQIPSIITPGRDGTRAAPGSVTTPRRRTTGHLRRQRTDDGDHLPQHRPGRRLGARRRGSLVLSGVLREIGLSAGNQYRDLCHDALRAEP